MNFNFIAAVIAQFSVHSPLAFIPASAIATRQASSEYSLATSMISWADCGTKQSSMTRINGQGVIIVLSLELIMC